MKTLLLNVSYTDNTDKFWFESCIKNMRVNFNPETDNIHEVIKDVCAEQDDMELTYKGKPQSNVYRDVLKDGEIVGYETVGYIYRGKTEIFDRDMDKPKVGLFDVWVTISEITQFPIVDLD